jgi:hypothetical protein
MSKTEKGKNDQAWEALFERYAIPARVEEDGKFLISAAQIKEYREPRLMAKFDHRIQLPPVFAKHRLAILPVSRGDYVIAPFEAYHLFEPSEQKVAHVSLPAHLQSLSADDIPSEAIAINCAWASGMLADFLGEEALHATVSGRMGSGQFDFYIENTRSAAPFPVSVRQSQIEIDAAFEGARSLALLEAKRDLAEDFLIRQLYYPFRVWSERIAKEVRPVFLVYSNGIFRLYEYRFQQPDFYNSLCLVKQKQYAIVDTAITLSDIKAAALRAGTAAEPPVPFPQANQFERVVNLCELLDSQELCREQVTEEYAFDVRQTNYYTDAARYLGLLERRYSEGRKPVYALTPAGKRILRLGYRPRQLALCEAILRRRVFRETFLRYLETGRMPGVEEIAGIMQAAPLYHVGKPSTYRRRASTVSGWVNWIVNLTGR